MVSLVRSFPASSHDSRPEPIHYHVLLNSLLQVRFGQLCKLTAAVCLAAVPFLGWRGLWWMPLRALALFFALFPIYVLRKAHLSVAHQPANTLFQLYLHEFATRKFLETLATYALSCWIIVGLYCKNLSDIKMVTQAKPYEHPRVNERYLYMSLHSLLMAFCYSCIHIGANYDMVHFPPTRMSPRARLQRQQVPIVANTLVYSVCIAIISPLIYLWFRSRIFKFGRDVALVFYYPLHRSQHPLSSSISSIPIGPSLLLHTIYTLLFTFFLWEVSNTCFSVYMTLGPVHRGKTVSSKSPDMNGSLISGLKSSSRPLTMTTAFQELCYIAIHDQNRRIDIFRDINRPVSIWKQILTECEAKIVAVRDQVTRKKQHSTNATDITPKSSKLIGSGSYASPLRVDENIFVKGSKRGGNDGSFSIKDNNNHAWLDSMQDPKAIQSKRVISKIEHVYDETTKTYRGEYQRLLSKFTQSYLGIPFRKTLKLEAERIIPNQTITFDAMTSLVQLTIASLQEDNLGTVQSDIPHILDLFCSTYVELRKFLSTRRSDLRCETELDVAQRITVSCIVKIISVFGQYFKNMEISSQTLYICRDLEGRI